MLKELACDPDKVLGRRRTGLAMVSVDRREGSSELACTESDNERCTAGCSWLGVGLIAKDSEMVSGFRRFWG